MRSTVSIRPRCRSGISYSRGTIAAGSSRISRPSVSTSESAATRIVPLEARVQPAGKARRDYQSRAVGVDQGMSGPGGACRARPGFNHNDFPLAAASSSCREAVTASHADLAEHINEAARFLGKGEEDAEINLRCQDICHIAILTMSPKRRLAAITAAGSKPQCIRQFSQRGSLPGPYFDQSVPATSSA